MPHPGRKSAIYGEASTPDGRGIPMTVDHAGVGLSDKAGMQADRLDTAIESLVQLCEDGGKVLNESAPMIAALMQRVSIEANRALKKIESLAAAEESAETTIPGINDMLARTLDITNKVTTIQDRVAKMLTNVVKAKDVAVRLRTFIATGDEEQHGLDQMSESALRRLINATANGESIPSSEFR